MTDWLTLGVAPDWAQKEWAEAKAKASRSNWEQTHAQRYGSSGGSKSAITKKNGIRGRHIARLKMMKGPFTYNEAADMWCISRHTAEDTIRDMRKRDLVYRHSMDGKYVRWWFYLRDIV